MSSDRKELTPDRREALFAALKARFEKNGGRHPGVTWDEVQAKLEASPEKLWSLEEMERTGGEPDVVRLDPTVDAYAFVDCSTESPKGRRSLCYDPEALQGRKEFQPESSAVERASAMGVEILTEAQYRALQALGEFDLKTSSWLATPPKVRTLGGAIFGDRRYDTVFIFHNGADAYYASRGFRSVLRL